LSTIISGKGLIKAVVSMRQREKHESEGYIERAGVDPVANKTTVEPRAGTEGREDLGEQCMIMEERREKGIG
jgi:hypothetical protein